MRNSRSGAPSNLEPRSSRSSLMFLSVNGTAQSYAWLSAPSGQDSHVLRRAHCTLHGELTPARERRGRRPRPARERLPHRKRPRAAAARAERLPERVAAAEERAARQALGRDHVGDPRVRDVAHPVAEPDQRALVLVLLAEVHARAKVSERGGETAHGAERLHPERDVGAVDGLDIGVEIAHRRAAVDQRQHVGDPVGEPSRRWHGEPRADRPADAGDVGGRLVPARAQRVVPAGIDQRVVVHEGEHIRAGPGGPLQSPVTRMREAGPGLAEVGGVLAAADHDRQRLRRDLIPKRLEGRVRGAVRAHRDPQIGLHGARLERGPVSRLDRPYSDRTKVQGQMQEMVIYGVSFDMVGKQPIVLLKTRDGNKFLPIWIGHPEAAAILMKLQGANTPRPMTHDLISEMLTELEVSCSRVAVTELRENTFYAEVTLQLNGREIPIDSRPSDALALAVRTGAPIFAAEDVISESAIEFEHEVEDTEEVVEKFKDFLDNVTPEDFAAGEEEEEEGEGEEEGPGPA